MGDKETNTEDGKLEELLAAVAKMQQVLDGQSRYIRDWSGRGDSDLRETANTAETGDDGDDARHRLLRTGREQRELEPKQRSETDSDSTEEEEWVAGDEEEWVGEEEESAVGREERKTYTEDVAEPQEEHREADNKNELEPEAVAECGPVQPESHPREESEWNGEVSSERYCLGCQKERDTGLGTASRNMKATTGQITIATQTSSDLDISQKAKTQTQWVLFYVTIPIFHWDFLFGLTVKSIPLFWIGMI